MLFAHVVIGWSNFLGMGFWTVNLKVTLILMSSFIAGSPNERLGGLIWLTVNEC